MFTEYHRRICRAAADRPCWQPWLEKDKSEIREVVMKCLGISPEWLPVITVQERKQIQAEDLSIELLRLVTWPGVVGTAHFYRLRGTENPPTPLVILFCGHGKGGKLNPEYQSMARHLARQGAQVLVPDNIGQGEREPMGHSNVLGPFACGTTLLGLIILESLAWIEWARLQPTVDASRISVIGNSGGGMICTFLAALTRGLAAISASGYPNRFDLIARKEKKHCHCNLIVDIVGKLDMSDLLACASPVPLLIFQGLNDHLFPCDVFYQTAREVGFAYAEAKAVAAFQYKVFPDGRHSWEEHSRRLTADFLRQTLRLTHDISIRASESLLAEDGYCLDAWPTDALDADALSQQLTGVHPRQAESLSEIFRPDVELSRIVPVTDRGDSQQILAQMECFCHG